MPRLARLDAPGETDHGMRRPHCKKDVYLKVLRPSQLAESVLAESTFRLIKDPNRKRGQKAPDDFLKGAGGSIPFQGMPRPLRKIKSINLLNS